MGFRLGSLPVFDDLNDRSVTRRAFKRALVVIRLVGLDSRKPRGYAAYGALRVCDSVPIDEVGYAHRDPRPCCYRRELNSSQSPTPIVSDCGRRFQTYGVPQIDYEPYLEA